MKKIFIPISAFVLSAIIFAGCGKAPQEEIQQEQQVVTYVEVMNTSSETIKNEYLYNGRIQPINEVVVSGTIQGKVATVNFDIGDYVNAGDVLYTMDTSDIEMSKKVAEASLASAEAGINSAQTNLELANGAAMASQIEAAKSALDNAEINLNSAKTSYENNKTLFENGIISQTEMDRFSDTYKNAQIGYNQAKESYELTLKMPEENTKRAEANLETAKAQKQSVVAQINSYQKSINDAVIKSPISGFVTACNVDAGTVLATNEPFRIVDTSNVKMSVSVSEDIINSISVGDSVSVNIPTVSNIPKIGEITIINPAANSGGTYDVEIKMGNDDQTLKSGMFGEVNFVKDRKDNTIVLPVDAVIIKGGEKYVFVFKDGKAVKTPVQTGINNGNEIEVTSGLLENTDVIIKGQTYIEDGDLVALSNDNSVNDILNDGEDANSSSPSGEKEE